MLLSVACLDTNSFTLLAVNSEPLKTCVSDSTTEPKKKKEEIYPTSLERSFVRLKANRRDRYHYCLKLSCKYQLSFIQGPRFQHTKM